ncbi:MULTISPECIES: hypothetical protein [Shewanella]|uniref:Uncharacterized protein n=1 Tax=Shewanella chilikensis TaxID=558541 RepID=A0A6G7LWW2_9GAMM|nr:MULTISPECIES: hypothetical protein [Shewanella]QIJ06125.1 hypothetical protein GII14_19460 [Shewanella chilikensis]
MTNLYCRECKLLVRLAESLRGQAVIAAVKNAVGPVARLRIRPQYLPGVNSLSRHSIPYRG